MASNSSDLGYQISHDLKDSLRSISLNTDCLLKSLEVNNTAQAKELAQATRATSQKLLKFIDGLVSLSVADLAETTERVKMDDLVKIAISESKPLIADRDAKISVSPLGEVQADSYLLEEVWKQLLQNALRYGREPLIEIGTERRGEFDRFYIRDDGPGVHPEIEAKLFTSIIKNSAETKHSGLGLLFCRRVIEKHGGKISYNRVGQQTEFSFEIPSLR